MPSKKKTDQTVETPDATVLQTDPEEALKSDISPGVTGEMLQTETEPTPEGALIWPGNDADTALHETDPGQVISNANSELADLAFNEEAGSGQTDSETASGDKKISEENEADNFESGESSATDANTAHETGSEDGLTLNTHDGQTDSENENSGSEDDVEIPEGTLNTAVHQTENESAGKDVSSAQKAPRRRTAAKKAAIKSQSDEKVKNTPESDKNTPDKSPSDSEAAQSKPTSAQSEKTSRRRKAASPAPTTNTPVVAIDEERSVETIEDKLKNDILDLVESMKGKKVLTGTIQGVESPEGSASMSYAVVYHGEFKVIIPADQTVDPPNDFRGREPAEILHYMVTKRLGAEIDFIVKGVDPKTGIAAASRLEAMAQKRKEYYFGKDRDGNNLLYEGISAEARIVSVIRAGIFVDLFGLEVYIPLRELSYQRWLDADSHYQPGQRVLVKILAIDRSDRNNLRVNASVKQASENPYAKALRKYSVGSRYVGTVSLVDTNGVFVSLDGGIDCLCSYPKRGRPPRGARVTVRIIGINDQSNRIWGAITHMSTAR